ncbi:glutathione S-transferase rho, partial [Silurus asotus]
MAEDMMLFWGSGSPPCWRVMIALEEKNLQGFHHKLLSFDKGEHKSEEVMKLNPRGQLPVFKHGDVVINESMAVCMYLENQFQSQGTRLIPGDVKEQALVLQRVFESSTLQQKM